MSYYLQCEENKTEGKRFCARGDIVVSGDFRAAYHVAKDGSRRRIKDKAAAQAFIGRVKESLAEQAQKRAVIDENVKASRVENAATVGGLLGMMAGMGPHVGV